MQQKHAVVLDFDALLQTGGANRPAPRSGDRVTMVIGNIARNIRSPWPTTQRRVAPVSGPHTHLSDQSVKRLYSATQNSLRGLADGFKTEPALRDEAIFLAAAVPLALVVAPNLAWYAGMIGVLVVVLAVELLNTAIEKLADHVTPEQNTDIRRIKDFGSAAVFCSLCLAGLIWLAALGARCGLF
jgi:diacylglycerol kinase (ATP)